MWKIICDYFTKSKKICEYSHHTTSFDEWVKMDEFKCKKKARCYVQEGKSEQIYLCYKHTTEVTKIPIEKKREDRFY